MKGFRASDKDCFKASPGWDHELISRHVKLCEGSEHHIANHVDGLCPKDERNTIFDGLSNYVPKTMPHTDLT